MSCKVNGVFVGEDVVEAFEQVGVFLRPQAFFLLIRLLIRIVALLVHRFAPQLN